MSSKEMRGGKSQRTSRIVKWTGIASRLREKLTPECGASGLQLNGISQLLETQLILNKQLLRKLNSKTKFQNSMSPTFQSGHLTPEYEVSHPNDYLRVTLQICLQTMRKSHSRMWRIRLAARRNRHEGKHTQNSPTPTAPFRLLESCSSNSTADHVKIAFLRMAHPSNSSQSRSFWDPAFRI
ncbi:hypothetical protein QR680_000564 [Steinernema hermaphroditum]|uniref:Uncharacterized protein n=1 Tax=Steinernema hermaphroditum TaxID=289476 RepID=A0AA39LEE1_9BILA|nr:hypothetical protein QR680_000564 [Steinernema hermaphroditum]